MAGKDGNDDNGGGDDGRSSPVRSRAASPAARSAGHGRTAHAATAHKQTQCPPEFVVRHVDDPDKAFKDLPPLPPKPATLASSQSPLSSSLSLSSPTPAPRRHAVSATRSPSSAGHDGRDGHENRKRVAEAGVSVFDRVSMPRPAVSPRCARHLGHDDHDHDGHDGSGGSGDWQTAASKRRDAQQINEIKRLLLRLKMEQTPLTIKPVLAIPLQKRGKEAHDNEGQQQQRSRIPIPPWRLSYKPTPTSAREGSRPLSSSSSQRQPSDPVHLFSSTAFKARRARHHIAARQLVDDDEFAARLAAADAAAGLDPHPGGVAPFLKRLVPFIVLPTPAVGVEENPYRRRFRVQMDRAFLHVVGRGPPASAWT
ncbi:hypothetical protein BC831DRAFT_451773 [Entophlyctis helioformis]|nr:hypothetical protein BC831DRAFT_451773 [Entophlyctis helioformis]